MTEWQPIETAPKDGTEMLAFWNRSNVYGIASFDDGRWADETGEVSAPTHWMPLPEPPAEGA